MSQTDPIEIKKRIDRLLKNALSRSEANRVVLGWSEPSMASFWEDLWQNRPKDAPILTQKEAFLLIMKTSFGTEYSESGQLRLTKTAFDEICTTLTRGIRLGHVVKRAIKDKSLDEEKLFRDARSEFQRLIKEDENFKRVRREI